MAHLTNPMFSHGFLCSPMLSHVFHRFYTAFELKSIKKPRPRGPRIKNLPLDENLANGRAGGGQILIRGLFFPGRAEPWVFILICIKFLNNMKKTYVNIKIIEKYSFQNSWARKQQG